MQLLRRKLLQNYRKQLKEYLIFSKNNSKQNQRNTMRFPCIISRANSLKEGYKTKNIMISKLLETIENLCRSKNYNS